jgi:hypothetical protein
LGYKTKIMVLDTLSFDSKISIILEDKIFQLEEMLITEELNAILTMARLDLKTRPVNST